MSIIVIFLTLIATLGYFDIVPFFFGIMVPVIELAIYASFAFLIIYDNLIDSNSKLIS